MDLTKILKVGDKVYSPILGDCTVAGINATAQHSIRVKCSDGNYNTFTKDGKFYSFSPECLLFPSENNRDQNNIPKFKNGDVIISPCGNIAIFSHIGSVGAKNNIIFYHCILPPIRPLKVKIDCGIGSVDNCSLATNKQKERIFKALKDNSYKWNAETEIIEKIVSFKPFGKALVRLHNTNEW